MDSDNSVQPVSTAGEDVQDVMEIDTPNGETVTKEKCSLLEIALKHKFGDLKARLLFGQNDEKHIPDVF